MPSLSAFLRANFPDATPFERGPYCPGGALAFYLGAVDDPFPDENELACHIEEARCNVEAASAGTPSRHALATARRIIRANDDGDTCKAWAILGRALDGIKVEASHVQRLQELGIIGRPRAQPSLETSVA